MTLEQKTEWLRNASAEDLIEQLRGTVVAMMSDHIPTAIEANEDYRLTKDELIRRIGGISVSE